MKKIQFIIIPVLQYAVSVAYQLRGASEAAKYGAIAVLVRSPTSHSVYSAHAGLVEYDPKLPQIPTASITVEDAELLDRFQARGESLTVRLRIDSHPDGNTTSRNLLIDYKGWKYPEEIVIFVGHLDSWDIGEGALDGGSAIALAMQVLSTLKTLGLKTKRTIRVALFTGHKFGEIGAKNYFENHINGSIRMVLDPGGGAFKPSGLMLKGMFLEPFPNVDSAKAFIYL